MINFEAVNYSLKINSTYIGMKFPKFLFVFLLFGLMISCTDNDKPLKLTSLNLRYNVKSDHIPVHQTVEFRLKGDDYLDYTDQMVLEVNGEAVEGNIYNFNQTGEFEIRAFVGDIKSNTVTFTVSEGMIISHKSLLKNQINTFTLYDVKTGVDISDQGIFYVNDEEINGHTFRTEVTGEYEVYAQYYTSENDDLITTDSQVFTVVAPVQRALIEDYTGTWCGYCPRLQSVIEEVLQMSDLVSSMAIHKSSSDSNPDPFEYEFVDNLVEVYNPYGEFPKGQINRTISWNDNNPQTVLEYVGGESTIGIAAKTRKRNSELTVEVRVASTLGLNNKKIVVAALENKLYHEQTNYLNNDPTSPWYQQGNPIPNYENNQVLRHAMTPIFGENIPTTEALQDFKKSYSMNMDAYFDNPEDAEVVIFVLNEDGMVEQVVGLGINENIEFQ